ncbi:hypothetical protein V498_06870 [Pseudogymnoascus sp. VKM F-4517 (FW-2822)]|nr:hypothetical protein V498_06870 [Pseudogymnoascus sp. VKM F-4517 (FW-2822)]
MKSDNLAIARFSSSSTRTIPDVALETPEEFEAARLYDYHLSLLRPGPTQQNLEEVTTAPIFTMPVVEHAEAIVDGKSLPAFPQYGLLAGLADAVRENLKSEGPSHSSVQDPRIFFNVAAPSSTFICGSQGSGKSHTLSCLLENCLIASDANRLPRPLTGLVFHYDTFICDAGGSPCEAAFLSSDPRIKVRVLCSPTNFRTIQRTYHAFGNIKIEPLRISEGDLNTKRMLDLMAVSRDGGPMPLYLHAVYRILREMRIEQQEMGTAFRYANFKERVAQTEMTPAQLSPLTQRLETLESFMPNTQTGATGKGRKSKAAVQHGNDWTTKSGWLTIVDLSCPCVTPEGACSLFNMCLSIFLEQDMTTGRIVALDEAHKFMNESAEAQTLTGTLLSIIRLQRHLGARIIICTQEPTISPALLDLCSVTIVHRFTSPEWMQSLKAHLAAVAPDMADKVPDAGDRHGPMGELTTGAKIKTTSLIFKKIVGLGVGEALIFSPSAMIDASVASGGSLGRAPVAATTAYTTPPLKYLNLVAVHSFLKSATNTTQEAIPSRRSPKLKATTEFSTSTFHHSIGKSVGREDFQTNMTRKEVALAHRLFGFSWHKPCCIVFWPLFYVEEIGHTVGLKAFEAAGVSELHKGGNKRLALVGDALIRLAILDGWFPSGASTKEGSNLVSNLASNNALKDVVERDNLVKFVVKNPCQKGKPQRTTLASTTEAIVGAVCLHSQRQQAIAASPEAQVITITEGVRRYSRCTASEA